MTASNITWLDNGVLKIGLLNDFGGGIGDILHYASGYRPYASNPVFDPHEPTMMTAALYGNSLAAANSYPFTTIIWDPNQAGGNDDDGNYIPAGVIEHSSTATTAYSKSAPVQFNWPKLDPTPTVNPDCDMVLEQWTELIGEVIKVRTKITYTGPDRSGRAYYDYPYNGSLLVGQDGTHYTQEMGTLQGGDRAKICAYLGASPWTNDALPAIWSPPDFPGWGRIYANVAKLLTSEDWVAIVNDSGQGIGYYSPNSDGWYAIWGYLTPLKVWDWKPVTGEVLDYTYYLTIGDLPTIRSRFYDLHIEAKNVTTTDFDLVFDSAGFPNAVDFIIYRDGVQAYVGPKIVTDPVDGSILRDANDLIVLEGEP